MTDDPFDRAVKRASVLSRSTDVNATIGLATRFMLGCLAAWAIVLAIHWWFLPDPAWLRTLHAVLFMLGIGYTIVMSVFVKSARRMGWFDGPEQP